MRICIPTETNTGKSAQVHAHFGSAPYFTVYDIEKDAVEVIENGNEHHAHGMCQPMNSLNGKNIDAVVCGGMGARAVARLNEAGIKAYRAMHGTIEDVIRQFKEGKLEEISVDGACQGHGCH